MTKSAFFHVGVNKTIAKIYGLEPPKIRDDGSLPFIPLPRHNDPDFVNLTYGDPWGRLAKLEKDDIAWFIESGVVDAKDWGYYLVAVLVVEAIYVKKCGEWSQSIPSAHMARIKNNAHEVRGDFAYAILLGDRDLSKLYFNRPIRISQGQDAYAEIKSILNLTASRPTTGYWFKKWLDDCATKRFTDFLGRMI